MILLGFCGSRYLSHRSVVMRAMRAQIPPGREKEYVVIHGDCQGTDKLADSCAREIGIQVIRVPAVWEAFGPAAGPVRNDLISKLLSSFMPDAKLVALPGGTGTASMVAKAKAAGVPVVEVA